MYSRQLAEFASDLKYTDLDDAVIDMTKKCIMDYIGVSIAGCANEPSLIWDRLIDRYSSKKEATIWRRGFPKTGYQYAACINAVYGHALEMDDLHSSSIVHPATVTIPTAIALGEHLNKSGKDIITAVVAGYDVGIRIGEAINPSSYWFWHTTSIAGNFASAAVAGKLLDLSAEQMNHGFGSAGSQAAGLWEFINDGAMTKTLHTGKAVINGILSAELASLGFTGATRILEGERGLIKAIAPEYDLQKLTIGFAKPYKIMENSFKPYACCRHTHSANYAIERLVDRFGVKAEHVKSIVDKTYQAAIDVTDNPNPKTVYAHKFSLQYCIAACLVYGNLLEQAFTKQSINNPLVKETMKKVKVVLDENIDKEYNDNPQKWIHDVAIETYDGKVFRERVEYPLGDANNPLEWNMVEKKFRMLTGPYLSKSDADRLMDNIYHLEKLDDINELFGHTVYQ
jgi:2-methylcitrate dehydratase PrpD